MKKVLKYLAVIFCIILGVLASMFIIYRDAAKFNEAMENYDFVRMDELLKKGYNINMPFLGTNHLIVAITTFKDVKIEMIKYLLENGADVNISGKRGMYPAQMALLLKRPDIVKLLISYHADTTVTLHGLTLAELASRSNQPELAACLSTQSCVTDYK